MATRYSYLLFHNLAEAFVIVIACGIFMVAWNTRSFTNNSYFTFIGIAYLFTAVVELLHILAYKGMPVFPGYGANLPTQLWIVARYIESLSLLAAPLLIDRRLRTIPVFLGYALVISLVLVSIFYWNIFPTCFIEGTGLTTFKIASEYVISAILLAAIFLLIRKRSRFDGKVFRLLIASVATTIASEMAFTLYTDVYGSMNMLGHFLMIISFYLLYKAVIQTGLTEPYTMLFQGLQQSNERYRALFDSALDLVYLHDFEGHFIDANDAALNLLGYKRQDIPSLNFASLLTEEQAAKALEVLQELKETGTQKEVAEFKLKCKDGNFVDVETKASVIYHNGKPYTIQGIGRDITERKQAEYDLEERLKELTCLYKVGLELQQDLEIDDLCRRVIEHLVIAMQFPDITAVLIELDNKQWASDKYSRELSHSLRAEIKAGKNIRGHLCVYYTEQRPFIILDEQNLITSVAQSLGMWLERKQAEKEIDFRAQLIDAATDSIIVHDFDGNIIYANEVACSSLGYTKEELMKMNLRDLAVPEYATVVEPKLPDFSEGGKAVFEFAHRRKDKSIMPVEIHSQIIESGGKKLILGIARDITERKKMQESLIITDRLAALGNMAGGFAHELNNPLTGVIGYAQLLLDRKDLPNDVRKDLTGIYKEAQRASEVIKNFMGFALKRPQPKQPIDINSLINDVLKLRHYEQKKANIRVNTNFDPDLPIVSVGPVRMHQVFLNIITNAEYFMSQAHKKGILTITTEKAGEMVKASFTDNGPGILPESITQIFNPFFTTKEIGQGIGLGLSICHSIVTEHGGNIYVESEPGKGATFTIELPINSNE